VGFRQPASTSTASLASGPDTLLVVPQPARRFRVIGVLVWTLALVGCAVNPPPAPQSTATSRSTAPPPLRKTQIIMGIDSIGAGFNPHLLTDLSAVNAAISALVLPSAFRPVEDPATPTGSRWEMDPTLLVSAEVTSENPFTVTYKIRPEAQWTDNAPIAADDFW
jgi:ABC-type transport system substrate-binding protein